MLKKIILFLSLTILVIISTFYKEKTQIVYNEVSSNFEYGQIYLIFENNILNTNNFEEYFKDIKVLKVYPYINPIYEKRIKANYSFIHNNHNYDLEILKKNYINKLRKNGLISEANEYEVNGIIIKKVLIESNLNDVQEIIRNDNVKYTFKKY